ncbi:MAG: HD domain-containing protein [Candidatus Nomurabacteria bacterium]|jgi:HD superfamily phosphohydrolase YqeK|nr:HD domain-containing protein [Candidatus Nomurabacteria bacterium]
MEKIIAKIIASPKYREAMRLIDEPTLGGKQVHVSFNSLHGIAHAKHVMNYAVDFLRQMDARPRDIELAKIAALTHDVALADHDKTNHAQRSAEIVRQWLTEYDMAKADINTICHAIAMHSRGEEINNLIDAAILLGDKMDLTGDRLNLTRPRKGYDAMTELLFLVDKVEFIIDKDVATLKYTVVSGFDTTLFRGWRKAVTIPAKVAKYLGKDFVIEIGDARYSLDEMLQLL